MAIEFKKQKLPKHLKPINNLYYVIENGRSHVIDSFKKLPQDMRELIIDLMIKMATIENFKSPKIVNNLHGYNYGELKPLPHRFFFFQKCGNNFIFFDYRIKKKDSLGDKAYKEINKKKERYENEFRKFIQRH